MVSTVDREIWTRAADVNAGGLLKLLGELLDDYKRRPGMDDIVRVTPHCIGENAYRTLLEALELKVRRNVSYIDHGWHVELRSGLWAHLVRTVQRLLLTHS